MHRRDGSDCQKQSCRGTLLVHIEIPPDGESSRVSRANNRPSAARIHVRLRKALMDCTSLNCSRLCHHGRYTRNSSTQRHNDHLATLRDIADCRSNRLNRRAELRKKLVRLEVCDRRLQKPSCGLGCQIRRDPNIVLLWFERRLSQELPSTIERHVQPLNSQVRIRNANHLRKFQS